MPELDIHSAKAEEVYRDIVRIPENVRKDTNGQVIEEGRICRISSGGRHTLVILRGAKECQATHKPPCIHLDEVTRKRLSLPGSGLAQFELQPVGWFGEFLWAWNATEIGYRISSRLGLLGLALGIIAFVLALPELCRMLAGLISWASRSCGAGH